MILRRFLPFVFGAFGLGCAVGQIASPPADASGTGPDPHDLATAGPAVPQAVVPVTPQGTAARVDFASQVRPIMEGRCRPCHFPGGQMHATLPFDSPETIRRLGTQLFTRIKDEEERAVIRAFLEQPAAAEAPPGTR